MGWYHELTDFLQLLLLCGSKRMHADYYYSVFDVLYIHIVTKL